MVRGYEKRPNAGTRSVRSYRGQVNATAELKALRGAAASPSHGSERIPWAGARLDMVVRTLCGQLACCCRNRRDGSAGSERGWRPRLLVRHARRRRDTRLGRHAASTSTADSGIRAYHDRMSRRSSPDHVDPDSARDARGSGHRERQAGRGVDGRDDTRLEARTPAEGMRGGASGGDGQISGVTVKLA